VYEQAVQLTAASGETWTLRRVTVKLKVKTRNGDTALVLLTNLPSAAADAITIASLYRTRWGIETAFQKLEKYLNSEIETLGYPKAALFGFCLALVAFNIYAVVMAALRAAHPLLDIDSTVSEYYLAGEIATTMTGLNIAVSQAEWAPFTHASTEQLAGYLLILAKYVDLRKLLKTTRGPSSRRHHAPSSRVNLMSRPQSCSRVPGRTPNDTLKGLDTSVFARAEGSACATPGHVQEKGLQSHKV
jgi:hypothetical protein